MTTFHCTNLYVGFIFFTNIAIAYTEQQGTSTLGNYTSHLPEALGWDYSNHWKDLNLSCEYFGQCQLSLLQS